MSRVWAFPSPNTFSMLPIKQLLARYVAGVSIDPFARDEQKL
jgi:hypothetical protein